MRGIPLCPFLIRQCLYLSILLTGTSSHRSILSPSFPCISVYPSSYDRDPCGVFLRVAGRSEFQLALRPGSETHLGFVYALGYFEIGFPVIEPRLRRYKYVTLNTCICLLLEFGVAPTCVLHLLSRVKRHSDRRPRSLLIIRSRAHACTGVSFHTSSISQS